ncbi:MAG: xanthine dehydrogenase family protein subunit M [Deltaproteobacteria bacterium]|nr:MAG: xanthine dehydrogenase family protein subunit M [Deltaproteobacteria bacterium]
MIRFDYLKPSTLEEALSLLYEHGEGAMLIAGGTDVMVEIKQRKIAPKALISLRGVKELEYIEPHNGGVRIGSMTTHRTLESSSLIKEKFPALADAVQNLGSVQIRNVATIGGNICNAAPSADTAPPLLVLGAEVRIRGPRGERVIPLEEFFVGPGQTVLNRGEILVEFIIPPAPAYTGSAYWKHTRRQAMDLPILGVALSLSLNKGEASNLRKLLAESATMEEILFSLEESGLVCQQARIALGVAAPTPMRAKKAEGVLKGAKLTGRKLDEAGRVASQEAQPRDTLRGAAWYRREMIQVLSKRLAIKCLERIFLGEKR